MLNILKNKKGQGLAEYALILALISIATILIMTALGADIGSVFVRVSNALLGV